MNIHAIRKKLKQIDPTIRISQDKFLGCARVTITEFEHKHKVPEIMQQYGLTAKYGWHPNDVDARSMIKTWVGDFYMEGTNP